MKRIRLLIAALLATTLFGVALLAPVGTTYAATPKATVCSTLGSGDDCTKQSANGLDLNKVLTAIINLISILVGVVSVIMIMISGFKYVTSAGDSNKVASAKNTLVYAVIGLVVVACAQIIVNYVLVKLKQ